MAAADDSADVVTVTELAPPNAFRTLFALVGSARSRGPLNRVELSQEAFDAVCLDPAFSTEALRVSGHRPIQPAADPLIVALARMLHTPVIIQK